MSQIGAWDMVEVLHITEAAFGDTPVSGTWLPVHRTTRFEPVYRPVLRPKIGIGRQNPSGWELAKSMWEFTIDTEMVKKEADPAYDPYTMIQYIIEKASGADGSPGNTLDSFSLLGKVDLTTDEFFWLKGCMLDRVDIAGRAVDELVTVRFHGLAQWGDYGTTDPVSGTASRQALPATDDSITFAECDVLYDPTTPASILADVSSFRLSLIRDLRPVGSDATTKTLYREFVPTSRRWEMEVEVDFNNRDEYEDFIDSTKTKITLEAPNLADGSIFALTEGYFMPPSGLPVSQLELMNVRLSGEWATLARSAHG